MAVNHLAVACGSCGETGATPVFTKNGYSLVQCAACDLAYIANPPDDAELTRIYAGDPDYHANLRNPASAEFKRMARVADRHLRFVRRHARRGTLLDVGCANGQFPAAAKAAGFNASAIEFSRSSAEFGRDHYGLDVHEGDLHSLDAPDATYDIITMFDVIEHVRDPMADLRAVRRLLKPDGLFIVSTPNIDGLFPRLSQRLAGKLDYWPHAEPPYHLFQFSVETLRAMLTNAGFEMGAVQHTNMPLSYSFGAPSTLARSPKMAAYALAFAPSAKLGPLIGMGDWFYATARPTPA